MEPHHLITKESAKALGTSPTSHGISRQVNGGISVELRFAVHLQSAFGTIWTMLSQAMGELLPSDFALGVSELGFVPASQTPE